MREPLGLHSSDADDGSQAEGAAPAAMWGKPFSWEEQICNGKE